MSLARAFPADLSDAAAQLQACGPGLSLRGGLAIEAALGHGER